MAAAAAAATRTFRRRGHGCPSPEPGSAPKEELPALEPVPRSGAAWRGARGKVPQPAQSLIRGFRRRRQPGMGGVLVANSVQPPSLQQEEEPERKRLPAEPGAAGPFPQAFAGGVVFEFGSREAFVRAVQDHRDLTLNGSGPIQYHLKDLR
uniref:Uncharacterized protein n=1 Tax=Sphaerodactylus townsendi TaxID=933632 RepID=A0ACB8EL85_9SAUR